MGYGTDDQGKPQPGPYGTEGYVASFGPEEPGLMRGGVPDPDAESPEEQRMRLQQKSGKFKARNDDDDDVGELDWTITYIDMITLLMIFFVVLSFLSMAAHKEYVNRQQAAVTDEKPLYGSSPFDGEGFTLVEGGRPANRSTVQSRYDDPEALNNSHDPAPSGEMRTGKEVEVAGISESELPSALDPEASAGPDAGNPEQAAGEAPQDPSSSPVEENRPGDSQLAQELQDMVDTSGLEGQVKIISEAQSITVRISDKILFASGQADLELSGVDLVRRLGPVLNEAGGLISVEGHTDNVPINTRLYPSNWELSAARAATVLRQLVVLGVPAERLRAIAYADTRPVAANNTAEDRASNRRVELVITSGP